MTNFRFGGMGRRCCGRKRTTAEKKIDSIARDDSFLIGCVPAGGVIPKIFATIKLPIRACSSAAPTAISRGKCFFSVLAGLRVHHQLANHRLRNAQTHQDLDVVALLWGRNEGFSPAATRLPRYCTGPFFLTRIKCACPAPATAPLDAWGRGTFAANLPLALKLFDASPAHDVIAFVRDNFDDQPFDAPETSAISTCSPRRRAGARSRKTLSR
jgi:hypothetical protein